MTRVSAQADSWFLRHNILRKMKACRHVEDVTLMMLRRHDADVITATPVATLMKADVDVAAAS